RGLTFTGIPAPAASQGAPGGLGAASSDSGDAARPALLDPVPAPAQVTATTGDNWIDGFQYTLPNVIDPSRQVRLDKVLGLGKGTAAVDGSTYVFSDSADPDNNWVLIGWDQQGEPFQPILLARGNVIVSPGTQATNSFSWSKGLYIVRNENPEVQSH